MKEVRAAAAVLQEPLESAQHHFVHHSEKPDEVRFPRTIRSNEHGDGAKCEVVELLDRAEASKAQCLNQMHLRFSPTKMDCSGRCLMFDGGSLASPVQIVTAVPEQCVDLRFHRGIHLDQRRPGAFEAFARNFLRPVDAEFAAAGDFRWWRGRARRTGLW